MHELGHTLGLHHGGDEADNHKPNYLSVMNYRYQTSVFGRPIDYSPGLLPTLDEEALLEALGLGPNAPIGLVLFGSHNAQLSARARGPINWNLSTKTGWLGSTAASFERR
jgi:hypothetical protein